MLLEEAIKIAKDYFLDKEIPNSTREWRFNCPPELTAGRINSMDFSVGDVLRALNPKVRKRAKPINYNIKNLGFESLTFKNTKGHFVCSKCKQPRVAERTTIAGWVSKGVKYCSQCRNVSGILKTPEHYNSFLDKDYTVTEVIPEAGNTKLNVKHLTCGNVKTYSSRHIINPDRKYLVCTVCEGLGEYGSKQEKLITEHIKQHYPELEILTQVKYSELVDTTRRWVCDVYIPLANLVLEITTKGNGFDRYFENLNEKIEVLLKNNYNAYVVYNTTQVDDIVRSLLKDKES